MQQNSCLSDEEVIATLDAVQPRRNLPIPETDPYFVDEEHEERCVTALMAASDAKLARGPAIPDGPDGVVLRISEGPYPDWAELPTDAQGGDEAKHEPLRGAFVESAEWIPATVAPSQVGFRENDAEPVSTLTWRKWQMIVASVLRELRFRSVSDGTVRRVFSHFGRQPVIRTWEKSNITQVQVQTPSGTVHVLSVIASGNKAYIAVRTSGAEDRKLEIEIEEDLAELSITKITDFFADDAELGIAVLQEVQDAMLTFQDMGLHKQLRFE